MEYTSPSSPTNDTSLPQIAGFAPIFLNEVDVAEGIAGICLSPSASGLPYGRVRTLVRVHSVPIGVFDLELPSGEMDQAQYSREIWRVMGPKIHEHLEGDGLPGPVPDDGSPILAGIEPGCSMDRERRLKCAPYVSVIVCTRDRPTSIAITLRSLSNLAYPNYEIILVDNAPSNDATRQVVEGLHAEMPLLRYVCEDRPGLSRARNRGLAEARGELVAITDDDVVVDPHWLSELVHGFGVGAKVVCVTGLILPKLLETRAQQLFEEFGGYSRGFSERVFDMGENRPADPMYPYRASVFGSGANTAFRTEYLRGIGGFDPVLGAGTPAKSGEELAVFVQLIVDGFQLVYEPGAILYHTHHREYDALKRQIYGYGVGNAAFLTSHFVANPRLFPSFCRKVPAAIRLTFDPQSSKNRTRTSNFPRELALLELRGLLAGASAYFRSRYKARGERRGSPTPQWSAQRGQRRS